MSSPKSEVRVSKKATDDGGSASKQAEGSGAPRILIPERGFDTTREEMMAFRLKIERLGWVHLCAPPPSAVMPVVREFYASGPTYKKKRQTVKVRDVRVEISADAIRRVYNLQVPNRDEFAALLADPPLEEILTVLAKPGATWTLTIKGEPTSILSKYLTTEARVWLRFVSAKLIPGTNMSRVTKERAALLFCIITERQVDVGLLIHRNILRALGEPNWGLWFPSLVCVLCSNAGVHWASTEEERQPLAPIDHHTVGRMEREALGPNLLIAEPGKSDTPVPPVTNDFAEPSAAKREASTQTTADELAPEQWAVLERFMAVQDRRMAAMEQMMQVVTQQIRQLLENEGLDVSDRPANVETTATGDEEETRVEPDDMAEEKERSPRTADYVHDDTAEGVIPSVPIGEAVVQQSGTEDPRDPTSAATREPEAEVRPSVNADIADLLTAAAQIAKEAVEAAGIDDSSEADGVEGKATDLEESEEVSAPPKPVDLSPVVQLQPGRYKRRGRRIPTTPVDSEEEVVVIVTPPTVVATPTTAAKVTSPAPVIGSSFSPSSADAVAKDKKGTISDEEDEIPLAARKSMVRSRTKMKAGRQPVRSVKSPVKRAVGITIRESRVPTPNPKVAITTSGVATPKRKKAPAKRKKAVTTGKAPVSKRTRVVSSSGQLFVDPSQNELARRLAELEREEKAGVVYSEDESKTESDEPADEVWADSDVSE